MRRICLCLLMLLACADVAAREVRLASPDSGACPDTVSAAKAEVRKPAAPIRDAAPARESHVRPSVHGDVGNAPRLRWHSFLPGMFR
ncbi:hypothetical protein [Lysobacter claricitrinus]|uniref:hypothetical protein n=1 Tax=Lysobacter claricitrinus TaxID=3367728 RepID=UPI0037DB6427